MEFFFTHCPGTLIASKAKDVQILSIEQAVMDIVSKVENNEMVLAQMFIKTPVHPQKANSAGINWVFFADTLNFSFWNNDLDAQYEVTYKGEKYTGYLAMCAAINRALDQGIPLTSPAFFTTLDVDGLGQLLIGDDGIPIPLLQERAACLNEVGHVLEKNWSGSFSEMLQASKNSAPDLLQLILDNFPCFRDGGSFEGTKVSFHKRAQILVADIWCLFEGSGEGRMAGIDGLTMFADYRVPQSLQHYGVFKYSDQLMDHLKAEKLLESGHRWEQEIRGCSIEAVERITAKVKEELAKRGSDAVVNSILVDQYLWGYRRQHNTEMGNCPYHRVRSIYY